MTRLLALAVLASLAGCTSAPIGTSDVVAGPGGKADDPAERVQIDRLGRPEITNFTIRDPQTKVAFNAEDPFAPNPAVAGVYKEYLAAGILFWDGLDNAHYTEAASAPGPYQWGDESLLGEELRGSQKLSADGQALLNMLSHDYLTVDVSKPCDVDSASYLDIELGGNDTCGGRTPNDDIIDTYVTVLVGGPQNAITGERSWGDGQGVTPRQAASNTWPYLAAPFGAPEL